MATLLQLAQQAFGSKLALEVLDGTFNSLAVDDDLERFTLDCFARVAQGTGNLTKLGALCNPKEGLGVGNFHGDRDRFAERAFGLWDLAMRFVGFAARRCRGNQVDCRDKSTT